MSQLAHHPHPRPNPIQITSQPIPAPPRSVIKGANRHTSIINLPTPRIHRLQQLIHLIITHLLPQIRQDIPQLPNPNKARHILIKDLEAATVFFRFARVTEAARAVEDLREGLEINCATSASPSQQS
jgi:hypothetical protein